MRLLRALYRLSRAMLHALHGWLIVVCLFPRLSQAQRDVRVQIWAAKMLLILGIRLRVLGQAPSLGPVLIVANHISWLDILVLHAARHCRFIAKAQLSRWPLLGTLATGAGTLYIQRESRRDALRMVRQMTVALRDGDVLAVFPEGTTSDGALVLPFHANLVESAIAADTPVQPVALDFVDAATGRRSFAPRYIDEDTLLGSLWRTLLAPALEVRLHWGCAQRALGRDRRTWAQALRQEVQTLRMAA